MIARHPSVSECAVFGVADADLGEVPHCALVLVQDVDSGALGEWCRRSLAPYKVPRAFHTVDALPRNAMGKVLKGVLPPARAEHGQDAIRRWKQPRRKNDVQ